MNQQLIFNIKTEAETIELAQNLAKMLKPGLFIALKGDLGAGKTFLVRAIIHALGFTGKIKSPTFTLVEPYQLESPPHTLTAEIYHFDLYRIADPDELDFIGIDEYFNDNSICFVEWPERGEPILPKPDLIINITHNNLSRSIQLIATTSASEPIINTLKPTAAKL